MGWKGMLLPRAVEGCEDLIPGAAAPGQIRGLDDEISAELDKLRPLARERFGDCVVSLPPQSRDFPGHMDTVGTDFLRQVGNDEARIAASNGQRKPTSLKLSIERFEARPQEGEALDAHVMALGEERWVEHEQGDNLAAVGGSRERRMVGDPKIPSKPDDCARWVRHSVSLPKR